MTIRKPSMTVPVLLVALLCPAMVTAQSPSPADVTPTSFKGRITMGACRGKPAQVVRGVSQARGTTCESTVLDMTDARLDGEATLSINSDAYPDGTILYGTAFHIENADGAWQEVPSVRIGYPDGTHSTTTIILVGEGGYDGLTAIAQAPLVAGVWTFDGFIVASGELP
jgi:hypothetical protein